MSGITWDRDIFEKLILEHRRAATKFAFGFLRNIEDAEDIVQEAFADIYLKTGKYKGKSSFKTYLFAIIKYKCWNMRKKKVWPVMDNSEICDFLPGPEERLIRNETQEELRAKIRLLKPAVQIALYLFYFEEFTIRDIALVLGKREGSVKTLIHRARRELGKYYEKEEEDGRPRIRQNRLAEN